MEKLFKTAKEYGKWYDTIVASGRRITEVCSSGMLKVILDSDGWEEEYVIRIKEWEEERMVRTWGGARAGAGRKKGADTIPFSCRLKANTKQYLQEEADKAGITVTECLETIIQIFRDEHKEG